MQKKTRSLLEELEAIGNNRDVSHVIESRAHNIITSAINLIEFINRHYDKDTSEVLEKKFVAMCGSEVAVAAVKEAIKSIRAAKHVIGVDSVDGGVVVEIASEKMDELWSRLGKGQQLTLLHVVDKKSKRRRVAAGVVAGHRPELVGTGNVAGLHIVQRFFRFQYWQRALHATRIDVFLKFHS